MKARIPIIPLLAALWILTLLMPACGDKSGNEDEAPEGEQVYPGNTFGGSGQGDSWSEWFHSAGCNVQVSVTHGDDARIALQIVNQSTGQILKNIVYMSAVTDEISIVNIPAGEYWVEVLATGSWSINLTGCIHTYKNPDDIEIDRSLYIGCDPGCCPGGLIGCDCGEGRCLCAGDAYDPACDCQCVGGASPAPSE